MSAYAADILAIMDLYFHMPMPAIPSIILLLTTQCIGFGLAGTSFTLSLALAYNRHAAESSGQPSSDVLARHACYSSALYHALLLKFLGYDSRSSHCHARSTESLHASIYRCLRLSVPPFPPFPHFDIDCDAVFGQQRVLVDENDGVGV